MQLFEALGHPLPKAVEDKYQQAIKQTNQARAGVQGLRYIYGNTPYPLFEFNRFLVDLGMVPLVIQTADLPGRPGRQGVYSSQARSLLGAACQHCPLQFVYDVLQPNLYLGHEYAHRLRKKNIALVRSDQAASMLGFEITHYALSSLQTAADELQQMHHAAEESRMSLVRYFPTPSDRMGILWSLMTIQQSIIIEYGPAGTTHYGIGFYSTLGVDQENRLFTTHMSEDDVVMGDVTRLEEAILEVDSSFHPEVIFIVASSISAVIG